MPPLPLWQDLLSHMALKGAVLLMVTFLLGLLLYRLSAARRYVLWIGAALALIALPLAIPFLPAWRVLPATAASLPFEFPEEETTVPQQRQSAEATAVPQVKAPSAPAQASPPIPASSPAPRLPSSPSFSWPDLLATLPLIWLGLSLLLLTRIGLSAWRLRCLGKQCSRLPAQPFADLAIELGLRRLPAFVLGPRHAVPMVWGIFRPRLLLPEGYENWPPNQLRSVLLHEFAHLKRRDPAALLIAQTMQALHSFNPLAWIILRRLRADQERACDDTVLRHGIRPSDYAQHLLNLSRSTRLAPGLSLCALAMARPAPVESRVTAILDPKRPRQPAGRRWSFALLALTFLIAAPLAMLHALEGAKLRGRILDRNGVVLAESTETQVRHYPLKALTSHVVGYTRRLNPKEPGRIVGGVAMEVQEDVPLAAGKDVTLTLDARIQQIAHRVLRDSGHTRGAITVMDPRDGGILAIVSLPSYDANQFIPALSKETWESLLANKDTPLLNRAFRDSTPAAAFLPVTALAAISAGKTDAHYECSGSVTYGNRSMLCWIGHKNGGHGTLSMQEALLHSCNCYWYQMGNAIGAEAIQETARQLGLGSASILQTKTALTPKWLGTPPDPKSLLAHTANLAIGQGLVSISPLQMTQLAAVLANGGRLPKQTLLQSEKAREWLADLSQQGKFSAEIEVLRKALWEKVNSDRGNAKGARSDRYAIAGINGTAQHWRNVNSQNTPDNRGWFIGFAPYEKPTLAFSIFVEGVKSGGSTCAPLAKQLVEQTLALPTDGSGPVDPVEAPVKTVSTKTLQELEESARAWSEKMKNFQPVKFPIDIDLKEPNQKSPKINPDDEKRWRWLQKVGDLQELPKDAQNLQGSLEGQTFPRTSTFTFQAPRESVRTWLSESPGYWRYQRGLRHFGEVSLLQAGIPAGNPPPQTIASLASILEFKQGPTEPGTLPEWPATGRIGVFECCDSRLTHCTVTLTHTADSLVNVAITYTVNLSRVRLTD